MQCDVDGEHYNDPGSGQRGGQLEAGGHCEWTQAVRAPGGTRRNGTQSSKHNSDIRLKEIIREHKVIFQQTQCDAFIKKRIIQAIF